jgi:putative FmdB family regulatory protein
MIIEYKCESCKKKIEFLVPKEKPKNICECGGKLKKLFSKGIFKI